MAKKKRKSPPRRRRVSGVGRAKVMDVLELAGGTVLGGMAGRMLSTSLGQGKDPKLVGAAQAIAGYFIAAKASGDIVKGVGVGMVANGLMDVAHAMGVIKGPGESDVYMLDYDQPMRVNGGDALLAGSDDYLSGIGYEGGDSLVAGYDDEINGYEDYE